MANKQDVKIAVIGAGVSGLYMTRLLLDKGYDVTLFEAQDRIGGRVKGGTFNGQKIDLGAQWLHQVAGEENSLTAILKKHHERYEADAEIADCPEDPAIVDEFIAYLEDRQFPEDRPLSVTLKEFSDDPLLESYMEASLVDMASSADHFSTKEYVRLIASITPDDYCLVNQSMYEFISSSFSDIPVDRLLLATPVNTIRHAANHVEITTVNGNDYTFNKVILSVPVSQLQQNRIEFVPGLPEAKRQAIQKIGMGTGLKIFIFFNKSILDTPSINNKFAPYYLQKKSGPYFVIISLLMGQFADRYYKHPEEYKGKILQEIAMLSGKDINTFLEGTIFQDWTQEPFIEGTYSFPLPGEGNARKIAAEPIDNTVFFIGEAMSTTLGYGFIHGAMDTALKLSQQF